MIPGRAGLARVWLVCLLLVLTACQRQADPQESDGAGGEADRSAGAVAGAQESAGSAGAAGDAVRRPRVGDCYRLRFADALAPVPDRTPVRCRSRHTSRTYHVGRVPRRVDGRPVRSLGMDSPQVAGLAARTCRERLGDFLGATEEQLRLSMVGTVWFTPSLEAAAAGARWVRCDAVLRGPGRTLLPLPETLRDAYDDPESARRLGMCATAAPGTSGFRRVPCGQGHSWRAVRAVTLPDGEDPPGAEELADLLEEPCTTAAREVAADPLEVTWGLEGPTRQRWRSGIRHGLCWVPTT